MKRFFVSISVVLICTYGASLYAQVGAGCLNPHKIDSLPFSLQNATNCGLGFHYFSPCPGPAQPSADPYMDSEEYILTYTPETDVEVNLVLKALSIDVPALYLLSDCPGSGSVQCIATMYQHNLQGDYEIKSTSLDSGLTYFIVVSGAGTCFDFDLEVTLLSTSIRKE